MRIFRQLKHAAIWTFKERGRRRIAVTLFVVVSAFIVGVLAPSEAVLIGAAVATLALILVQVIFGVLDGRDQRRFEKALIGSEDQPSK